MGKFVIAAALACLAAVQLFAVGPVMAQDKVVIGFSQATTTEPWRLLFNAELRAEAAKHDNVTLVVRNAQDSVDKQIADVEELLARDVDAILISPKVAGPLTPIVNKVHDSGVPIFVLDRDVANDRYTQFIGGDNRLIGEAAGRYVLDLLGGPGKAKGSIVEIWGGMGSTPAQDRHRGFASVLESEPGIQFIIEPTDGDWKQDQGYKIMADALALGQPIDVVYAHNDPMAFGAYLAASDVGKADGIKFIGIDGIPGEGVRWVHEGVLEATFLYATPGAEAIRQTLQLLRGESIEKRVTLPTQAITRENAASILERYGIEP
ncbi:MAG: substrate-binding domain-containing protein [Rhodospirillaceae bacterium]